MSSKVKLILTILGLAAIIIPAVLLVVFSNKKTDPTQNSLPTGTRQIDKNAIQKDISSPTPGAMSSPPPTFISPKPAASPKLSPTPNLQGTPSGVN